jgi:serpin B
MRKLLALLACVGLICSVGMGQRAAARPEVGKSGGVAEGGNEFALDLYAKLAASEKGNLFFSPSSIHTALAMTYIGAAGTTADQMARTLHYPPAKDRLASAFGKFLKVLNTPRMTTTYSGPAGREKKKRVYELVVSNALWPLKGYRFKPDFVEMVRKEFSASLEEQDFAKDPDGSRKNINDTIATQTKEKIKDLIPHSAITAQTRLVLTNAIYFRSNWEDKFEKNATRDAPFKLSADKNATCRMMSRQGHYGYFEEAGLQVLEMPYMSDDLSMFVLLPRKVDGLAELEKKLTAANVARWLGQGKLALVNVSFPRFKTTGQFSLAQTLKAMGMTDAFTDRADFSGMCATEKLQISEVIHKSFVAVDEEGTEAAATAVLMMATASAPRAPEEPKVFTADHPFVFLIRHAGTGAILFAGRVVAPETPRAGRPN